MKTGVFGGTFNPVHKGHIMLAEYCMDSVGLDRIIMIPTAVPPHKISKNLASENDRLNMCELACKGKKNFSVSDIEIKKTGKKLHLRNCYTAKKKFILMITYIQ